MLRLYIQPFEQDFKTQLLTGRHKLLWQKHGASINQAFEEVTGVPFRQGIRVKVRYKAPPHSKTAHHVFPWSYSGTTNIKAVLLCYQDYKPEMEALILKELCHELGHRLQDQYSLDDHISPDPIDAYNYETHRILFVFLVDVLKQAFDTRLHRLIKEYTEELYALSPNSTYKDAWNWAVNLSAARRQVITRDMFAGRYNDTLLPRR